MCHTKEIKINLTLQGKLEQKVSSDKTIKQKQLLNFGLPLQVKAFISA